MLSKNGLVGDGPSPSAAIRHRASKVANLWLFDSPKNGSRLTITGDVPFMHMVLLEGDRQVQKYWLVGDPFCIEKTSRSSALPGYVQVTKADGPDLWIRFARRGTGSTKSTARSLELGQLRAAATASGATFAEYSEQELRGRELEFENWLILCACITRAKGQGHYTESTQFLEVLQLHSTISVHTLLSVPRVDRAVMLAVIASSLQKGIIETELQCRPFGLDSILRRRSI